MARRLCGRLVVVAVLAELPVVAYGVFRQSAAGASDVHLMAVALAGAAALVLAVHLAERSILRDVEAMISAARKLAAGDLSARAPVSSTGEIAALSTAFNEMAAVVQDRVAEHAGNAVERQKLQTQLQQGQRLEAIGCLAGSIAHDFNNLITVIFACVDEAMHEAGPASSEHLVEIKSAAQRAASLTRQLLAFSRKQVLQPRVFDLNEALAEVDRLLRRLIGEDIELQTTCDPGLRPVFLDPHQLEQVIVNIAVNARDAMPAGGCLTLSTRAMAFDEAHVHGGVAIPAGDYVRLTIQDTGAGMTAEVRERIFEPFFSTKGADGTGLGLATAYGIVRQSDGFIVVESEPGHGTTFSIYFPASTAIADTGVPCEQAAAVRGDQTILVIEDEASVRSLVVAALRRSGYDALEAGSPSEALALAASIDHLDMVLVDLMLPEMSGSLVAAEVLKIWPHVPISYMSGYSDAEMIKRGLLDSDACFLQKPFRLQALTTHIQAVLGEMSGVVARVRRPDGLSAATMAGVSG